MILDFEDFKKTINFQSVTYDEFKSRVSVLDISDRSGQFNVRSDLPTFLQRVAKKDNRISRLETFYTKLYQMLVTDAETSLRQWFDSYVNLQKSPEWYLTLPVGNSYDSENNQFLGQKNAKYGRICKNINYNDFYNTKKLYANDSEYVFGLMKAMYERFHLRNSMVGPAFFDHICKIENSYKTVWTDFMMGANKASIFNPYTYKSILDVVFNGETLFAPVMGWNAYQIAFYNSNFKHFIATDVMPNVVNNSHELHKLFKSRNENALFDFDEKTIDTYLCPSEQLDIKHDFVNKYRDSVDAVLFSPPYFDLELYPGEGQSTTSFPNYEDWLEGYWRATVKLCKEVMRPGARFGFVISNFRNFDKVDNTISQDMKQVVEQELEFHKHYKVRWSAMSGSRQAHKTRDGNFEDLWVFEKM